MKNLDEIACAKVTFFNNAQVIATAAADQEFLDELWPLELMGEFEAGRARMCNPQNRGANTQCVANADRLLDDSAHRKILPKHTRRKQAPAEFAFPIRVVFERVR